MSPQAPNPLLVGIVEALFGFPPLFSLASNQARQMIIKRGEAIGVNWKGTLEDLKRQDWAAEMASVQDPTVQFPSYYTQPFHAYPKGNLSWDAALEVTLASRSVHAPVMDPDNKQMDPQGDVNLRRGYSKCMLQLLQEHTPQLAVRDVVDFGCATGLSSRELMDSLPRVADGGSVSVTGVDLSPHFLAVGRYEQRQRQAGSGEEERLRFVHAPAESTGLPGASYDLVSACLLFHELPQDATRAILREAARLLRPGGVLSIMEMNPCSPAFGRIFGNPIAYVAFKSTEPWLLEYMSLDLHAAIHEAGFEVPQQLENSPRHRTVIAIRKA